jgi:type IV secretion system protein VirB9
MKLITIKSAIPPAAVHRLLAVACLAITACTVRDAAADALPIKGTLDERIRVAPYSAEQVYQLYGYVGYQIDLQFETGETFVGLAAGDIEGLGFVAQDNHLFLKPKVAKIGTNLTVLTSRRHYQFDYSATAQRPDMTRDPVIYAVRFTYPPLPGRNESAEAAARTEEALTHADSSRPRNIDYWFCGNPAVKPISASDDGVHTRLRFDAKTELPALFVRNEDGSESLLNFSVEDGDVVIHRIAHQFVLRRGKLTGCVVNKHFAGVGDRLESNTIAPGVERATKSVEHAKAGQP